MHYRISFNGSLYEPQCNALRNSIASAALTASCESITVLFSSGGGSTDQGFALYNFLRSFNKPLHFHAVGSVGSMAFPVFLGVSMRTASPTASFLMHSFDYTFEGKQSIAQIEEALLRLKADAASYRSAVTLSTKIAADTVNKVLTAHLPPIVYHAEDAKAAGIVSEVVELNPDGQDQGGVQVWTVGW